VNKSNLKQKVVKGAIWTLMEKLSCQVVTFVVSMVLARLLTPSDYGTVALTGIFFAIAGALVDCGFGGALVQKKDSDDLDFNSVFYLNLFLSIVAYAALFVSAPWIAEFYKTPILIPLVRVSAVTFIFGAINTVQNAELIKRMLFHLSFRISLISSIVSAVCGITLALLGYGVWSLVWLSIIHGFTGVVARWFIIAWRPKLMFSFARLKPLFSYGWKMAASGLLDSFFNNLNGLLIGKFYSKPDLAYVNKGNSVPQLFMSQVDDTLGRVSFPALVQMQDDPIALREAMRKMMRCSTFLVFPLMVGLAACSKSALLLLYGEQWAPAAPYMQLACFTFALWPFHTINLRGITALGRSDIFLKLEIIKKVLYVGFILAFLRYGVLVFMAMTAFAMGPLGVIINAWPNRRLLNYTIRMQIVDVLPAAAICMVEGAVVIGVDLLFAALGLSYSATGSNWSLAAVLFLQFVFGASVFGLLAFVFRLEPAAEYAKMLAGIVGRRCPRLARLLIERFGIR